MAFCAICAAPQGNVALTDGNGVVSVPLAAGTYDVYAMRGITSSLAHAAVTVAAADQSSVDDSQDDEPGSDLRHSLESARVRERRRSADGS